MNDTRIHRVEMIISTLLRTGVVASIVLIVLGIALIFVNRPASMNSQEQLLAMTRPGAEFPHTIAAVASGITALQGEAVIAFGLLVLIATPVMRVAISIFAFVYERDGAFTLITSVVLVLLLLSFFLGAGG